MFKQIDGIAIGSPLGPVLAKIFLGFHESRIPESQLPRLYRRFVDDTFALVESRSSAEKFLKCLNGLHPGRRSSDFLQELRISGFPRF